MPRLTKIYTRTGDDGTTSLGTKERVLKDSLRVKANGDIDELNASIGLAIASALEEDISTTLTRIQNELFNLGSQLAFPTQNGASAGVPSVTSEHVDALESAIDELLQEVGPLDNFILPGGSDGAAALHSARTICRRAERSLVTLSQAEDLEEITLIYLNRLSDALFVMARYENKMKGISDIIWDTTL
jgi:cob(I)alamin adenosyltransferase